MTSPRPAPAALWCALGAGVLLAACGADESPDPAPTTTTTSPTATAAVGTTAPVPTSSGPAFDCTTVRAAQDELDDAYAAELDALGLKRGDPRAQSVFTVVTTTEGPEYYAAVLAAAPPGSLPDAQVVLDYYTRLATQVGTVDVASAEDLTAAMSAIDDAGVAVNPDPAAATTVVQAQERLQAAVERDCAGSAPATSTSPSTSPEGTPTGTDVQTPG